MVHEPPLPMDEESGENVDWRLRAYPTSSVFGRMCGADASAFFVGASVVGASHFRESRGCEDSCFGAFLEPRVTVLAVADGLGSVTFGALGSRVAVRAAVVGALERIATFPKSSLDGVARAAVGSARRALLVHSRQMRVEGHESVEARDLACTLVVAVCKDSNVAVAQIGDGAVVACTEGRILVLSGPTGSEYVNEVIPLTSSRFREHLRVVGPVSNVTSVALFTDGCQRSFTARHGDQLEAFNGFFEPLFKYCHEYSDSPELLDQLRAFLESPRLTGVSDDDKTLLVYGYRQAADRGDAEDL